MHKITQPVCAFSHRCFVSRRLFTVIDAVHVRPEHYQQLNEQQIISLHPQSHHIHLAYKNNKFHQKNAKKHWFNAPDRYEHTSLATFKYIHLATTEETYISVKSAVSAGFKHSDAIIVQ